MVASKKKRKLIFIDLFCGAGGTTSGIHNAIVGNFHIAEVLACVNHDEKAIESHFSNHKKTKHFTEDIRTLDVTQIIKLVAEARIKNPGAKICLWASLECINFSKAKGGMARDADSRTLAEHLFRYITAIDPDYIFIENVEEFMSWGPLICKTVKDENGVESCPIDFEPKFIEIPYKKPRYHRVNGCMVQRFKTKIRDGWEVVWHGVPESKTKGVDYVRWCNKIQEMGYTYQYRILNSADFGAYTSRKRLFITFGKIGLPVAWPTPTHAKNPEKAAMFGTLEKWKAVKHVLQLEEHGRSIFGRKKPLSEKTLARIYAGLVKYVAGGKNAFILKYNSINKATGHHVPPSIDEPCPTIAVQHRLGLCTVEKDAPGFLAAYYGTGDNVSSLESPSPTIRTKDGIAFIECCNTEQFIDKQFSGTENHQSINVPAGTILPNDKHCLISTELAQNQFIEIKHSQGKQDQPIDSPMGSLTTVTKENLITAEQFIVDTQFNNVGSDIGSPLGVITANRKYHYLVNPQWGINSGSSIENPCFTIIARMDKTPPYIVTTESGAIAIRIYDTDSEFTIKIKEFMAMYGIIDVKMRMLFVNELLKIQGFPDDYILVGNEARKKKFIGNSVVPLVAQRLIEAIAESLYQEELLRAA